eukprot:CAMPEP_0176329400 /NCGR_PEP_ID=MMETSP0121_2-20121125/75463_1 /TAXON_ID=160619 /ORGANISM="Kryptoperidinium foliaceum, Strain CCMP 1326" /LENGTH=37 /DNA_ID= /DNA_START= /DNA_END= /DNA_ORIENTATION=
MAPKTPVATRLGSPNPLRHCSTKASYNAFASAPPMAC